MSSILKGAHFDFRYFFLLILSIKKVLGKFDQKSQNDPFDMKISNFGVWKVLVSNIAFDFDCFVYLLSLRKMFYRQKLSKKQEWSLRLKKFQVKCWNFETVTYFHSVLLFLASFCFWVTRLLWWHVFTGNVKLEMPKIYQTGIFSYFPMSWEFSDNIHMLTFR